MKKILITFGGAQYDKTTKLITETKGIDEVRVYDDVWLMKQDFYRLNHWLWRHPHKRGFGWYAWKPFIIWHALEHAQEGDVVMYLDADTYPIADLSMLYDIASKNGIMLFKSMNHKQINWCKQDCYTIMSKIKNPNEDAGVARFMLFKKGNWLATQFLMEWLAYSINPKATTFDKSENEHDDLIEHRCEQAIMTNLAHKYKIKLHREACQAGNSFGEDKDLYTQLFVQDNPNPQETLQALGSQYANIQ
jgi:hypothetical protein